MKQRSDQTKTFHNNNAKYPRKAGISGFTLVQGLLIMSLVLIVGGVAIVFTQSKEESIDKKNNIAGDADNISNSVENSAPNLGDMNGDRYLDSNQNSVASTPNVVIGNGAYTSLEITGGCRNIVWLEHLSESESKDNASIDFPVGIWDFDLMCENAGDTATVKIFLDSEYDVSGWDFYAHDGSNYEVVPEIGYEIQELDGLNLTTISYTITDGGVHDQDGEPDGTIKHLSGAGIDGAAPVIKLSTPHDDATNVSIDTVIGLVMNEYVIPGTGDIRLYESDGDILIDTVAIKSNMISDDTVVIKTSTDLQYDTEYYILIDDGIFQDGSGNSYAGITSKKVLNFTTEEEDDITGPKIISSIPEDDDEEVEVDADIVLVMDEEVIPQTGNITIKKMSDHSVVEEIPLTSKMVNENTITITPSNHLEMETGYYLLIDEAIMNDDVGNEFEGIQKSSTLNFTTGSPEIDFVVTTDGNTFSFEAFTGNWYASKIEIEKHGTIWTNGKKYAHNMGGEEWDEHFMVYYDDLTKLEDGELSFESQGDGISNVCILASCEVEMFVGRQTQPSEEDLEHPSIVSTIPADNAIEIALDADIVLQVSEEVVAFAGELDIYEVEEDILVERIMITQEMISGDTITVTPDYYFDYGTEYYITMSSNALHDLAGNYLPGVGGSSAWNFTSEVYVDRIHPTLNSTIPQDDATDMPVDAPIVFEMDEDMSPGTGIITIKKTSDDSVVEEISVNSKMISGNTVTVQPSKLLDHSTRYYVIVDETAIQDTTGNSYAGFSGSTDLNFLTKPSEVLGPVAFSLSDNESDPAYTPYFGDYWDSGYVSDMTHENIYTNGVKYVVHAFSDAYFTDTLIEAQNEEFLSTYQIQDEKVLHCEQECREVGDKMIVGGGEIEFIISSNGGDPDFVLHGYDGGYYNSWENIGNGPIYTNGLRYASPDAERRYYLETDIQAATEEPYTGVDPIYTIFGTQPNLNALNIQRYSDEFPVGSSVPE